MSQQPSIPGEEMGTTKLLLSFETLMMTQLKGIELQSQQCSYSLSRLWTKEEEEEEDTLVKYAYLLVITASQIDESSFFRKTSKVLRTPLCNQ